jgi:cation diffusion facilitator family transporter
MKRFTRWISAKLIRDYQRINDLKVRAQYGALEGWTSIVVNSVLFLVKLAMGLYIASVSLVADAVHTLSDSATSIVLLLGFQAAKRPSDKEHPFGHGRMEAVSALVISVLLFVAGFELLKGSIHRIIEPRVSTASLWIIALVIATMAVKELMARFSLELGNIIDSAALKADAFHHRSDAISTAFVVVALVASRFGFNRADGTMGCFVSLIIFFSAYKIAKEAINPLLGEPPSKQTLREIETVAKGHNGVLGVHDIICHRYGQTNIISLHIEVSDRLSAPELHTLAEVVEEDITARMGGSVVVHIDPINKEHPQYEAIAKTIENIVSSEKKVHSFHELRIVGCQVNKCNVVFDISLQKDVDEKDARDVIRSIKDKFREKFPEMKVFIKAEPRYVYNV